MKSIPANQDSLEDPPGHLAQQIEGNGWFSLLVSLLRSAVGQQSSPSAVTIILEHHIIIVGIPAGTPLITPSLQSHSSTFWHQM